MLGVFRLVSILAFHSPPAPAQPYYTTRPQDIGIAPSALPPPLQYAMRPRSPVPPCLRSPKPAARLPLPSFFVARISIRNRYPLHAHLVHSALVRLRVVASAATNSGARPSRTGWLVTSSVNNRRSRGRSRTHRSATIGRLKFRENFLPSSPLNQMIIGQRHEKNAFSRHSPSAHRRRPRRYRRRR